MTPTGSPLSRRGTLLYPDVELCPNSTEAPRIHPRRGGNADASRPIPGADRLNEPIPAPFGGPGGGRHPRPPAPRCEVNDSRIGLQGSDGPDEFKPRNFSYFQ